MAMKIRLARGGSKKRPFYRVVAADSRMPRDGRYVEKLGTYNPLLAKDSEERVQLNTDRDHLVRVDPLVRRLAGEVLGDFNHFRRTRHTADQHHLTDLVGGVTGVRQAGLEGRNGALIERVTDLLQLGAAEGDIQVLGAAGVGGDEWQIHISLDRR